MRRTQKVILTCSQSQVNGQMKMIKKLIYFILLLVAIGLFAGCFHQRSYTEIHSGKQNAPVHSPINVGFDIDDTILFSTPAFERGFKSGEKPFSKKFWEIVNGSDRQYSAVKKKTEQMIKGHQKRGDAVFAITAREPFNGDYLKTFLSERLGIKRENIYFSPPGKSELMRQLNIKLFYGDSDSDISDAHAAGAKGIRIQRSDKSSYKNKYHPGSLGEEIMPDSDQ